jgi:serine/threonine protein kinase
MVAVKKIARAFENLEETKRTYREIVLMRNLQHECIQCILDVFSSPQPQFDDVYLVTDLMETDLRRIIASRQQLSVSHVQWITYQLFCGLKYLHSAHILHRDLKANGSCRVCAVVSDCFFQGKFLFCTVFFFVLPFSCFASELVLTFHEVRPLVFDAPVGAVHD